MIENIKNIMKWMNENQWLNLIFLILALLGIIVSIYLYFKGKRRKTPVYLIKTFNLIKDRVTKLDRVKIVCDERTIKNLSITKVSLWNRGNEVINKTDIAPKEPIRIVVDNDFEILDAIVSKVKNEANNFSILISPDKKSVIIDFDYFYTNEGILLEVYHTGTSGNNIKLKGSLKDLPHLSTAEHNKDFLFDYIFDNSFGLLENRLSDNGWRIYVICLSPITFLLSYLVGPFQTIYGLTRINAIPDAFSLQGEQ